MVQKIEKDVARFKDIVRGKVRDNLRRYISHGEMIGKRGSDLVSVPLPQLDIPRFRYGDRGNGGVSSGDGQPGQPIGPGQGDGGAGNGPGGHILEVDLSFEELADILGESLALPRIQPKGDSNIVEERDRYTGISTAGPDSLRHFKRTYRKALRRQIASGTYDAGRPMVIPIREDTRYRSAKPIRKPQAQAVILYMMDISGSMGAEQKEIVRIESFWIDTWLRSQYEGIETRYIVHDADAKEVDQHTFFHTRESGGTVISSAYRLCADIIDAEYPVNDWNIYALHFSDGDNWGDDDQRCVDLLRVRLLPKVNLFGYAQVFSPYGSGRFIHELNEALGSNEKVVLSEVADRDGILDSIKEILGKGY